MLPFIQCHHTRGRADCGGFLKLNNKESIGFCALLPIVVKRKNSTMMWLMKALLVAVCISNSPSWVPPMGAHTEAEWWLMSSQTTCRAGNLKCTLVALVRIVKK